MKINVQFSENECLFDAAFGENECLFDAAFGEIHEVEQTNIPSDYGKITYTQDKFIIVS
jgi:hypothetical protein